MTSSPFQENLAVSRKCVTVLGLILLQGACASPDPLQNSQSWYYIAEGPVDSKLLHLRNDGVFGLYLRTHFTIDERGKGTWRMDHSGNFELSGAWRRHVVRSPFDVGGFGGNGGPTLGDIRKEISDFLKANSGSSYSANEIRQLGVRDGGEQVEGQDLRWTLVPITIRADRVTKGDLEGLIEAIDAYPREGGETVIHATPIACGLKTFLHWMDGGPGWVEDSLEEMKNAVEGDSILPSYNPVFFQVTKLEFEKALGEGHPFLFRPEMNRQK
jgi:hypothetical protein